MLPLWVVTQEDEQAEMMKLLQSADSASNDKKLNADLRAKIYEQTRMIAELRHDEVNRQQTSKARRRPLVVHFHSLSRRNKAAQK